MPGACPARGRWASLGSHRSKQRRLVEPALLRGQCELGNQVDRHRCQVLDGAIAGTDAIHLDAPELLLGWGLELDHALKGADLPKLGLDNYVPLADHRTVLVQNVDRQRVLEPTAPTRHRHR